MANLIEDIRFVNLRKRKEIEIDVPEDNNPTGNHVFKALEKLFLKNDTYEKCEHQSIYIFCLVKN